MLFHTTFFKKSVKSTKKLLHRYITLNAIAERSGINKAQLGHYAQGVRNAKPQQRERIICAIRKLGSELISIE